MNDKITVLPSDDPDAASAEVELVAKWERPLASPGEPKPLDVSVLLIIRTDRNPEQRGWEEYLKKCARFAMQKYYAGLQKTVDPGPGKFHVIAPHEAGGWYVHATYLVKGM